MYHLTKRIIDVLLAVMLLTLLLPLLLVVMILLRLTGEGEVFYAQRRIGLKNNFFKILKFATMQKDSPNIGTGSITLRNDPRVTSVGHYLRMSKINELPQLINVLKGEMSLVGPRPFMESTFDTYPEHVQQRIYDVKPGLTSIGSIVFRDEEDLISNSGEDPGLYYRNVISPVKGELELWYQSRANLYSDFKILVLTAIAILFPKPSIVKLFFRDLPPSAVEFVENAAKN